MRDGVGPLLLALAAGLMTGSLGGCEYGKQAIREEAIEAGVGKWVIDPRTGEEAFFLGWGQ